MNAKESWYKSNFIVVGSNFNFSYYNTQAEKCLVNSNFNSKRRFSEYFANLKFNSYKMRKMQKKKRKKEAKWRKKGKIKSYTRNCISDPLDYSCVTCVKISVTISRDWQCLIWSISITWLWVFLWWTETGPSFSRSSL